MSIYFLLEPVTGLVKIGKAKDIEHRLAGIINQSPLPAEVVKIIDGYSDEEYELHRRFEEHRRKGEWFEYAPIASQIEALTSVELTFPKRKVDHRVNVTCPTCGKDKQCWARHASITRKKECVSCSQKRRFAEMDPEEKARVCAKGAENFDAAREKVAAKATEAANQRWEVTNHCHGCGKELPNASATWRQSRTLSDPRYCDPCRSKARGAGKRGGGRCRGLRDTAARRALIELGSAWLVARALKCSEGAVRNWMSGANQPSNGYKEDIAHTYGIAIELWDTV